jgi:hypothetical protein
LVWFLGKCFPFILGGKHFLKIMKNLEMSLFADYIKFDSQTFDCYIYFATRWLHTRWSAASIYGLFSLISLYFLCLKCLRYFMLNPGSFGPFVFGC